MKNKAIVEELKRVLGDLGIHVKVQPSVTTSSYYLTLDHGVLKKIRVGDHSGKPKYHYTYEIGDHIPKYTEITRASVYGKEFTQYKYPTIKLGDLIRDILIARTNVRAKYGRENYQNFVQHGEEKELRRA